MAWDLDLIRPDRSLTDTTDTKAARDTQAARSLLTAAAVRARAHGLLQSGLDGRLEHFTIDLGRLDAAADEVVRTIREAYPSLDIPFHARWRHFSAGGHDRWEAVREGVQWQDLADMARAAFDLAIVSVLLDAGAGPQWRYQEGRTGETYARSEGLAVASFDMFIGGLFSSRPEDPFRADAQALVALTPEELAAGFQVGPDNPLVGLEGRAALLNRLGRGGRRRRCVRPGGRASTRRAIRRDRGDGRGTEIKAIAILEALLTMSVPIWPGRIRSAASTSATPGAIRSPADEGTTKGLVPFHKLSQWLSYSLIEPLEWAGYRVVDVDGLTGLPEYRNGGLFLDSGVLALKDPAEADTPARGRLGPGGGMARPDGGASRPDCGPDPFEARVRRGAISRSPRCSRAGPGRRGGAAREERAGRLAAPDGHQRRDGVLT